MKRLNINSAGIDFYVKARKDTIQSVFVVAPVCLLIFIMFFIMIVGMTINLLYILIWPIILIGTVFIYLPLFYRKKYTNHLIKEIVINNETVAIETFSWFLYNPISFNVDIQNIEIVEIKDESFFKGKKIGIIKSKMSTDGVFYLILDFFDVASIEKFISELKS